jgi:hypothetical protein
MGDKMQVKLVDQRKIDVILGDVTETIHEAQRLTERPYTAEDHQRYEYMMGHLNHCLAAVTILCYLNLAEGRDIYLGFLDLCTDALIKWRWPNGKD